MPKTRYTRHSRRSALQAAASFAPVGASKSRARASCSACVTGRSAGEATITAITDRGECAACKVTVRKESGDAASKKPALDHTTLNLVIQYNNAHPSQKLQLINTSGSFVYAYQWMSSNPEVATVDPEGLVTAQNPGTTTITALATNGQALRCAVTVNSDVGKVTLNKRDLLLRTVGSKEALTASVAVEDGVNVPITWVSSCLLYTSDAADEL